MKPYDSAKDTNNHRGRVRELIKMAIANLRQRGRVHDDSKLHDPEKSVFDEVTTRLKGMTYGSQEYKDSLKEMGPALEHHYANNDHHPEWSSDGIVAMSLLSILEMLMDWKAAGERHDNGCILKSIEHNRERFGMGEQLTQILLNTIDELGLADPEAIGEARCRVLFSAESERKPAKKPAYVKNEPYETNPYRYTVTGPEQDGEIEICQEGERVTMSLFLTLSDVEHMLTRFELVESEPEPVETPSSYHDSKLPYCPIFNE